MSIPGKVLIALLSSLVVAAVASYLEAAYSFVGLLIPTAVAAVASVVLSHRALPVPEAIATDTATGAAPAQPRGADGGAGRRKDRGTQGSTGSNGREDQRRGKRGGQRAAHREGQGQDRRDDKRSGKRGRGDKQVEHGRGADRSSGQRRSPASEGKPGNTVHRSDAEEGTVKWFNVSKGYGFIIRESGEEIFVHHRSVAGDGRGRLEDGAPVRFRVAETDKGPQAEDVEPL